MTEYSVFGWLILPLALALLLALAWLLRRARAEAADVRATDLHVAVAPGPDRTGELRLLQLSDMHWGVSVFDLRRVVAAARDFDPHAILLTGDLVEARRDGTFDLEPLADFAAMAPTFYVYGNAEHRNEARYGPLRDEFSRLGLRRLHNSHEVLEANGWRVVFAGVDDALRGHPDYHRALGDLPQADLHVLLVHEPTEWENVLGRPIDLMLSGHTHGGQVRLPLIGPAYSHSVAERSVMSGLFRLPRDSRARPTAAGRRAGAGESEQISVEHSAGDPPLLYVTRGLGTVLFHRRLGCPPEIVRITVTRCLGAQASLPATPASRKTGRRAHQSRNPRQ